MYIMDYKTGWETRTEAAIMLVHQAVVTSDRPLPNVDAVIVTGDYAGVSTHAIWAFCEPLSSELPPKFLVPGTSVTYQGN
jgi:hypothetical protein